MRLQEVIWTGSAEKLFQRPDLRQTMRGARAAMLLAAGLAGGCGCNARQRDQECEPSKALSLQVSRIMPLRVRGGACVRYYCGTQHR